MGRRYAILLLSCAFWVLADQASKAAILGRFTPWESQEVIAGFFNLVLVHNKGAAFGLFNSLGENGHLWFFAIIGLAAFAMIAILAYTAKNERPWFFLALGSILGGAAGNLIDRFNHGFVVDFLDFYLGETHWPAFNAADVAICLGAAGLALSILWPRKRKETSPPPC